MKSNGKKIIFSLIMVLLLGSSIGYAQNNNYRTNNYYRSYNNQSNNERYFINYNNSYNSYLEYFFNNMRFAPTRPQAPVEDVQKPDNNPAPNVQPSNPVPDVKPNKPQPDIKPNNPIPDINTGTKSSIEMEVVELVNIERQKSGLAPLTHSNELSRVAKAKSQDMANNNYFSHNSPTYGDPFAMMRSFGIQYKTAGENIAKGYSSAQSVVRGWMNSSGHRENILNPSFGKIGVGYINANGSTYWTQMFTD